MMPWNLKPATLYQSEGLHLHDRRFRGGDDYVYNVPNAKIWGWDVMTKYTTVCLALMWPITEPAAKTPIPAIYLQY